MLIKKISMEGGPFSVLALTDLKQELRIDDDNDIETGRLTRIIRASIAFFENKTNFYLRQLTFDLGIKNSDALGAEDRSIESFTDLYSPRDNVFYRNSNIKLFPVPIGEIISNEIFKFSYIGRDNSLIELSSTELARLNTTNAFSIRRDSPLLLAVDFSILRDFVEEHFINTFQDTYLTIRLKTSPSDDIFIEDEITECLLRIALKLYEYPDDDVHLLQDTFINETIFKYNLNLEI